MNKGISGEFIAPIFSETDKIDNQKRDSKYENMLECIYDFAEIIAKQDQELLEAKAKLENFKAEIEESLVGEYIDPLTGCFSSKLFERIKSEQFNPTRDINKIAIVFIDANGLKEINNRPIELGGGHDAGDKMIKDIAVYLRNNFRVDDTVMRPYASGDEFLIVCRNRNGEPDFEKNLNKRVRHIRKLTKNESFSFATGVAVYGSTRSNRPVDQDLDDTKKRAEEKMYKCKERMYRCQEC